MNVVQMHERLRFYVDRARSPRFKTDFHYDQALNIAMDQVIDDRFDNIKRKRKYSFELFQRIRDELRTIVKSQTIIPSGNVLTFPIDYRFEVGLIVTNSQGVFPSRAISYNEFKVVNLNTFENPIPEEPVHIEDQNGLNVEMGNTVFVSASLYYVRNPLVIFKGTTNITAGPNLIVGKTYHVTIGTVTHNLVTYNAGDEFVAVNVNLFGTGTVVQVQNCELPDNIHEELVQVAASILMGSVEAYNKSLLLDKESEKS